MSNNLINDMSKLTTIEEKYLQNLIDKNIWCICSYVEQSILSKENITSIDLGIGELSILVEDNKIKYKFIPSKELEDNIRKTVINDKNPLKFHLEKNLIKKITDTYKDLL